MQALIRGVCYYQLLSNGVLAVKRGVCLVMPKARVGLGDLRSAEQQIPSMIHRCQVAGCQVRNKTLRVVLIWENNQQQGGLMNQTQAFYTPKAILFL